MEASESSFSDWESVNENAHDIRIPPGAGDADPTPPPERRVVIELPPGGLVRDDGAATAAGNSGDGPSAKASSLSTISSFVLVSRLDVLSLQSEEPSGDGSSSRNEPAPRDDGSQSSFSRHLEILSLSSGELEGRRASDASRSSADSRGGLEGLEDALAGAAGPEESHDEVEDLPYPEDSLALEAGQCVYEYLKECFYTQASVLNREKFNAIPEIVISDFTITGYLGKGCFCDVFEVVCNYGEPNQKVYALKCLRPQICSDPDQFTIGAEDLVHETAILANVDHPNIIKLYGRAEGDLNDAFLLNDGYFILIERLHEILPDRMNSWRKNPVRAQRGPSSRQLEVARSVADAVAYLHSKRIVFRDLKPDNVGFDGRGVAKLFDFGFATGMPEPDDDNPAGLLFDRCGTPRYMAPEVAREQGYGLEADVYSFGLLLWEVCALEKPFRDVMSAKELERRVFVGGHRPAVGGHWLGAVREVIRCCWSTDPGQRPCWGEVKASLESATRGVLLLAEDDPLARRSPQKGRGWSGR